MTISAVPNDDRECLKRRYSLYQTTISHSPERLKRRSVEPVFGGPPVSNDGTHIVYQVGVMSEPTAVDLPPTPDARAPTLANGPTSL